MIQDLRGEGDCYLEPFGSCGVLLGRCENIFECFPSFWRPSALGARWAFQSRFAKHSFRKTHEAEAPGGHLRPKKFGKWHSFACAVARVG